MCTNSLDAGGLLWMWIVPSVLLLPPFFYRVQKILQTPLSAKWPFPHAFGVYKTHFFERNFHLINNPHAAFPFSCIQRKGQTHGRDKFRIDTGGFKRPKKCSKIQREPRGWKSAAKLNNRYPSLYTVRARRAGNGCFKRLNGDSSWYIWGNAVFIGSYIWL